MATEKTVELLRAKFPDRLPVIVTKNPKSDLPDLPKKKYLVPDDFTVGRFAFELRNSLKIPAAQSMYLFVGESHVLPSINSLMGTVYSKYKNSAGVLEVIYTGEATFGTPSRLH